MSGLAYSNGTSTAYGYDTFYGLTSVAHRFVGGSGAKAGVTFSTTLDVDERRQADAVDAASTQWHPPASSTTTDTVNADNELLFPNTAYWYGDMIQDPTVPGIGVTDTSWDSKASLLTLNNRSTSRAPRKTRSHGVTVGLLPLRLARERR